MQPDKHLVKLDKAHYIFVYPPIFSVNSDKGR